MGVGHVALALGASKAAPRMNVGWLVLAAMLSDFLLGIFAMTGLEHATVPPDYATKHYLLFTFPYSHGLLALLLWAVIAAYLISRAYGSDRNRVWIVVALVVLSHFVLDGLVHVAGLPLAAENSPKLGLGLWNHMPLELGIETVMAIAGVALYLKLSGFGAPALGRYGMVIFMALVTMMTWTQLLATAPPKPRQLTVAWIVVPLAFSAIAYALDRKRARQVAL
ncbi:MAG: hypothetical protein LAO24_00260 [Acidobacteriia bacterium]|nr:hypothetical protein [Terriglobia bacterium]